MDNIPYCVLLSYPRSGNSWFRYCMEVLTEQYSYPNSNFSKNARKKSGLIKLKYPYIVCKEHGLRDNNNLRRTAIINDKEIYNKVKLIMLVRNYKEVIYRHTSKPDIKETVFGKPYNYICNILDFEKWKDNKKLLIYYEDLMNNPKKELERSLTFLEKDTSSLNDFMDNYEKHKKSSLYAYDIQCGSVTRGVDNLYYCKKIPLDIKIKWDLYLETKYKKIYKKYLERYKEK